MVTEKKALKIPDVLIELGCAIECKGTHVHYYFPKKDRVGFFSNVDGNKLYCLSTANKRRKNPKPVTTRVQTILFSRDQWTPSKARKWLVDHGKKHPTPDITDDYLRYRQEPPEDFQRGSFRTITFSKSDGIKSVIARPLHYNPSSVDEVISSRRDDVNRGIKLYEDWHEFEPVTGSLWTPPRGFLFRVDRAQHIVYESDKWSGKPQQYIHDFTHPPLMWVNNKTAPTVLVLTGGKIKVRKSGVTG